MGPLLTVTQWKDLDIIIGLTEVLGRQLAHSEGPAKTISILDISRGLYI